MFGMFDEAELPQPPQQQDKLQPTSQKAYLASSPPPKNTSCSSDQPVFHHRRQLPSPPLQLTGSAHACQTSGAPPLPQARLPYHGPAGR